jgi:hypothetical protein
MRSRRITPSNSNSDPVAEFAAGGGEGTVAAADAELGGLYIGRAKEIHDMDERVTSTCRPLLRAGHAAIPLSLPTDLNISQVHLEGRLRGELEFEIFHRTISKPNLIFAES